MKDNMITEHFCTGGNWDNDKHRFVCEHETQPNSAPDQTPQSTFGEKLRTIILRTINDSKTGVIDLKDDNGLDGADWAVKDITSLVLESLGDEIDVNKISSAHDLYSGMPAPYAKGFRDGFNTAQGMIFAQQRSIITKENKL